MIDPSNITNYDQSQPELEESLLFWILAAGKNGTRAASILNSWIEKFMHIDISLFNALREYKSLANLVDLCYTASTGCQNNKARTIYELINSNLNLKTCSAEDLEAVFGIGRKTSRCFILHSRKGARYAGLDTHALKFLKLMGVKKVPKTTPSTKKEYLRLEKKFLKFSDKYKKTPADLDLLIWNEYSIKLKGD